MKQRVLRLVSASLIVLLLAPVGVAAAHAPPDPSTIDSAAAVVLDPPTGLVLYEKQPHLRLGMGSCTKVMTALLALRRLPITRWMTVPQSAPGGAGCMIGLEPGDRITVRQAVRALLMKSANDAGITLACAVSGSEERFVDLMNRQARRFGLSDTHYRNSTGRGASARHFTSAYDLAVLSQIAMRNQEFRDTVGRRTAIIRWRPGHSVAVTMGNPLFDFDWADGVKGGLTKSARRCLAGSGRPGLRWLIVVTLRGEARAQVLADQVALFDYGSSLFEQKTLATLGEIHGEIRAGGATVPALAAADVVAVVRSAASVTRTVTLPPALSEIPPAGTTIGTVEFFSDGVSVGKTDLVAGQPVGA